MNQAEQMREAAASWCADEANSCDDAVKWGGHRAYIANCKAAAYALRNASNVIRALPLPLADPLADPRVKALVEATKRVLFNYHHGNGLEALWAAYDALDAALRGLTGEGGE